MSKRGIMKNTDRLEQDEGIVFSQAEVPEVVDYLYSRLSDCKIMAFSGPLGAGKTTLIRKLLRKCGIEESITSPTFIYVNRYQNNKGQTFYHFDLYRMEHLSDFLEAGFDEYLQEPNSWIFVEWPEVIASILKNNCCYIILDYHNNKRKLRIKR